MKIVLVSNCSLDIEQYVKFKTSVLISPSKSLISSCCVTHDESMPNKQVRNLSNGSKDTCLLLSYYNGIVFDTD